MSAQLEELRAVLISPEAVDPVNSLRGKGKGEGHRNATARLATARRWIKDAETGAVDSAEVARIHAFVMYVGDRRDLTLEGEGAAIEAWRTIKDDCRTWRYFFGPNWFVDGPYWPQWTLDTVA